MPRSQARSGHQREAVELLVSILFCLSELLHGQAGQVIMAWTQQVF
jgi:hypothetical protein